MGTLPCAYGLASAVLESGDNNKNDPNDARSVAVAALRSKARRQVSADDHAAVLRVWSRRHRDLGRAKNQAACRLHAVFCELVPGGVSEEITAAQAARILGSVKPYGAAGQRPGATWPPSSWRTCAAWTSTRPRSGRPP
jgi:transposase